MGVIAEIIDFFVTLFVDCGIDKLTRRKKTEKKSYDRENTCPVLKCSICNGEQVAGFKNIHTGKFEEITVIRSEKELKEFMETYDIQEMSKEY